MSCISGFVVLDLVSTKLSEGGGKHVFEMLHFCVERPCAPTSWARPLHARRQARNQPRDRHATSSPLSNPSTPGCYVIRHLLNRK